MEASERTFYIYCHTAPNGKRYIGQTSMNPKKRWNRGWGYLGCTYFHHAIEKYGWDNIRHDIICVVHSEELAHAFEKYYIQKYDTFNHEHGYNLTLGGEGTLGHAVSEECKRKISEANTGNFWDESRKIEWSNALKGSGNPMYGRHHSEEMRKKMSEERTGRRLAPEHREKVTRALLEQVALQKKPIRQLDMDGNLIATYSSFKEAEESTGFDHSCIVPVCQGKGDKAYGFRWEYEDDELRALADERRANRPTAGFDVIQTDLDGNEIARFKSMSEAERATGVSRNRIVECCRGSVKSHNGFVWRFANADQPVAKTPAVIQRDTDGNVIARYESVDEAAMATGTKPYGIRASCRGAKKSSNGFIWEYEDKDVLNRRTGLPSGVIQFDMDGTEIARYKSLSSAMKATGHDRHRIAECCKGELESYRGFTWRYEDAA